MSLFLSIDLYFLSLSIILSFYSISLFYLSILSLYSISLFYLYLSLLLLSTVFLLNQPHGKPLSNHSPAFPKTHSYHCTIPNRVILLTTTATLLLLRTSYILSYYYSTQSIRMDGWRMLQYLLHIYGVQPSSVRVTKHFYSLRAIASDRLPSTFHGVPVQTLTTLLSDGDKSILRSLLSIMISQLSLQTLYKILTCMLVFRIILLYQLGTNQLWKIPRPRPVAPTLLRRT